MTFRDALASGTEILELNGISDAKLDAWYLLEHVTGIKKAKYFMIQTDPMDESDYNKYIELINKRANHIPYQHIVGCQDFMGLTFKVNEHVLIPRQDTETLVEKALELSKEGGKVLDVCTGSGCILISLLVHGKGLSGMGVDISDEALQVARENGEALAKNAKFIHSDLFSNVNERYNMIVSNPPYIRTADIEELETEVKNHEPRLALDGTEDGLYFYRRIISEASDYLLEEGYLLFEIGYDQGEDVSSLMKEAGFMDVKVISDLAGKDRVVMGHL